MTSKKMGVMSTGHGIEPGCLGAIVDQRVLTSVLICEALMRLNGSSPCTWKKMCVWGLELDWGQIQITVGPKHVETEY